MGQALYRKYRPRSLDDLAGQEHIAKTLAQALKSKQLSHAYLFTGPRGVGKTSVARILAHAINEIKYEDGSPHIDIIEIDAASNRRIDEIRELREKVHMAPLSAKYKVYIIDEVHMLTREAFNALLKTLEEPPAHVVFILATTDVHKLPETIISRTQRYSFKPITVSAATKALEGIAKKEKLEVDSEALSLIAEHSQGSLRDAISLLDQARSHSSKITVDSVTEMIGLLPAKQLEELVSLTLDVGRTAELVNKLDALYEQGFMAPTIAKQLSDLIRQKIIDGDSDIDKVSALKLLEALIEVPASINPERYLEISLLANQPSISTQTPPEAPKKEEAVKKSQEPPKTKAKSTPKQPFNEELWPDILASLKKKHNTVYSVVRMAKPNFSEANKLILGFNFEFHKKRLSESSNKQMLAQVIHDMTGQDLEIECVIDKSSKANVDKVSKSSANEPIDTNISSIFNGAELLES